MKNWGNVILGVVLLLGLQSFLMASGYQTGTDRFCKNPKKYLKQVLKGRRPNKVKNDLFKIGILCQSASVVAPERGLLGGQKPEHLVDVLFRLSQRANSKFKIEALFAPEHGFDGRKGAYEYVDHAKHAQIGCPIYSIHGEVRAPKQEWLAGLSAVVIDLPNVGVRCYTYIATMVYMIQAAAKADLPVIVLDRPNPNKAWKMSNDRVSDDRRYYCAALDISFLHGMTMGQIAVQAAEECGALVKVIAVKGSDAKANKYMRQNFVPPSPNLRSLQAIACYPITVALENINYSEGRGTVLPFEQFGAPWVKGEELAQRLNALNLLGVLFEAVTFTPQKLEHAASPRHEGTVCGGVIMKFSDQAQVRPMQTARAITAMLFALYPEQTQWNTRKGGKFLVDDMFAGSQWREEVEMSAQAYAATFAKINAAKKSIKK
jgi:uncharacterized protein YbbC (DUF1343 family)